VKSEKRARIRIPLLCQAGATFGVTAYLTNSIVPGLIVHICGDLAFFTMVWPHDPARRLISAGGADVSFWIDLTLALVFTALAIAAFWRLARMTRHSNHGNEPATDSA
jgi:hypothetical protein